VVKRDNFLKKSVFLTPIMKKVKRKCKICGISFKSTPKAKYCVICRYQVIIDNARKWRLANPEKYRLCKKKSRHKHRKKYYETAKIWRKNNPDKVKAMQKRSDARPERRNRDKKYRKLHPRKVKAKERRYYYNHRKLCIQRVIDYHRRNPEVKKRHDYNYHKKIYATPKGKLALYMHTAIWFALKKDRKNKKDNGWSKLVGYSAEQLKRHIKKQFKKGMTWKKYLSSKIHIDHRIPKSWFQYKKPTDIEFRLCWALENLQPMWGKENLHKGNSLAHPTKNQLRNHLIKKMLKRNGYV